MKRGIKASLITLTIADYRDERWRITGYGIPGYENAGRPKSGRQTPVQTNAPAKTLREQQSN